MNKKEKTERRKSRIALTVLYTFVIFCTVALTVLLSGCVLYLLIHMGIISESGDFLSDARHMIIYMGFISMVVASVIAFLTGDMPLKPLARVTARMNQLANGDFSVRLSFGPPIDKYPAIKSLTESFNLMAEELEKTEMLREDFVNNFSHEFKTPIVSIAGFAKLLKRGNLTEKQKLEYLDIIEEESMRLSYMATNVLNLTKVENQSILTDVSTYNLSEQMRSSVLLLENKWMKKKLEFSLEFDEYEIQANEELMKQVWINLIDNAVKFSPEYGLILIRIKDSEEHYEVSVANEGKEIPEESRSRIFQKFYQADESHATEGNGVGLAIVKKVIELHKGKVDVSCSNGIITFKVTLPKVI